MDVYNERLEFLGDALLEHIISDVLYNKEPLLNEGDMTKLRANIVCEKTLSDVMKSLNMQEYMFLGKTEKKGDNISAAILGDVFEAIIGAIYIDGGFEIAKTICLELLDEKIFNALNGEKLNVDYKTELQEILQVDGNVNIEYVLVSENGPDHNKEFFVEVYCNEKKLGEGTGKSKKKAEQQAASIAINSLKK